MVGIDHGGEIMGIGEIKYIWLVFINKCRTQRFIDVLFFFNTTKIYAQNYLLLLMQQKNGN